MTDSISQNNSSPGDSLTPAPYRTGARCFRLVRDQDVSGVSGTGVVAHGTVYPSGKATLAWDGSRASVCVYDCLADVEAIHGHDGRTRIVFDQPPPRSRPA